MSRRPGQPFAVPAFITDRATPHMALMLQFDVERMFSDQIQVGKAGKNKSLRRLFSRTTAAEPTVDVPKLERDVCALIQSESERLCSFVLDQHDSFVQLTLQTLAFVHSETLATQLDALAAHLMLDHSATQHARIAAQRMFDTRLLIRVGDCQLVERIYREAASAGYTGEFAERRVSTVRQYLAAFVTARVRQTALLHALPMGWRLHPKTHRPLGEREIEQQEQRIIGEFPLLLIGLLAHCNLCDWMDRFIGQILENCA